MKDQSRKPLNLGPREEGASLVSILVAVGLMGIVAVLSSRSFRNIDSASRRIDASLAGKDVEEQLLSTITQAITRRTLGPTVSSAALRTSCGGLSSGNFSPDLPVFANLPNQWIQSFTPITSAAADAPATLKTEVNAHCAALAVHSNLSNPSRWGTCYQIDKRSTALPKGLDLSTFLSYRHAYLLVNVQWADLRSAIINRPNKDFNFGNATLYSDWALRQGAKRCSETAVWCSGGAMANPGHGYLMLYQLHWSVPDGAGGLLHRKKKGLLRINLPTERQGCG